MAPAVKHEGPRNQDSLSLRCQCSWSRHQSIISSPQKASRLPFPLGRNYDFVRAHFRKSLPDRGGSCRLLAPGILGIEVLKISLKLFVHFHHPKVILQNYTVTVTCRLNTVFLWRNVTDYKIIIPKKQCSSNFTFLILPSWSCSNSPGRIWRMFFSAVGRWATQRVALHPENLESDIDNLISKLKLSQINTSRL